MKQAGHGPAPDQGIDVEESARRALCAKKPLCQKGWPRLSESLAARNNIQGIFAPKNARNMPPFSRQRFMANLCPTANLSGNALLRCDTTHKAKNSFNALYKNEF